MSSSWERRCDEHMVPVRDMPNARTCISTGRGETVGISSMSLRLDILNGFGLTGRTHTVCVVAILGNEL